MVYYYPNDVFGQLSTSRFRGLSKTKPMIPASLACLTRESESLIEIDLAPWVGLQLQNLYLKSLDLSCPPVIPEKFQSTAYGFGV